MNRSMLRSSIKSKFDYRSMLVGYGATLPLSPTMFLPGEGYSTAVNKMVFSTEVMSTSSATITLSSLYLVGFSNGSENGFVLASAVGTNKYSLKTDTNYLMSYVPPTLAGPYKAGTISGTAGYYISNPGSAMSGALVNKWDYSTDTVTTSTALQSYTNIGAYNNYTFSNSPSIYFGGGNPAGASYYGGLLKFNTSTSTASSLWADATATSRAYTSGAENGSTAGYIGGGNMMPYNTFPTNILKVVFATDTTYSTLAATLSTARSPARVGVQASVCAYYAGGKTSGSSVAVSTTSMEKLTYSTETRSAMSTVVDRDGFVTWNTQ